MANIKYLNAEHIFGRADVTVQTIIINGNKVIYCYYENGYYSYIDGVENLYNFLAGDTDARFFHSDDDTDFEKILNIV